MNLRVLLYFLDAGNEVYLVRGYGTSLVIEPRREIQYRE